MSKSTSTVILRPIVNEKENITIIDMNNILSWIRQRQLQTPAAILLESYRPMSFLLGQMLLAVEPLLPGVKTGRLGHAVSAWDTTDPEQMDSVIAELISGDSAKVS